MLFLDYLLSYVLYFYILKGMLEKVIILKCFKLYLYNLYLWNVLVCVSLRILNTIEREVRFVFIFFNFGEVCVCFILLIIDKFIKFYR